MLHSSLYSPWARHVVVTHCPPPWPRCHHRRSRATGPRCRSQPLVSTWPCCLVASRDYATCRRSTSPLQAGDAPWPERRLEAGSLLRSPPSGPCLSSRLLYRLPPCLLCRSILVVLSAALFFDHGDWSSVGEASVCCNVNFRRILGYSSPIGDSLTSHPL
jgi:hypothetical protein